MCAGGVTDGLHRMDECRCGGTGAFCCRDAACKTVRYHFSLVALQLTYTRGYSHCSTASAVAEAVDNCDVAATLAD